MSENEDQLSQDHSQNYNGNNGSNQKQSQQNYEDDVSWPYGDIYKPATFVLRANLPIKKQRNSEEKTIWVC